MEVAPYAKVVWSLMDEESPEYGIRRPRVLPFVNDEHGGIILEMEDPMDPNDFSVILRYSLSQWKLQVFKHSFPSLTMHTLPTRQETAVFCMIMFC